jgi:hypothetical protein
MEQTPDLFQLNAILSAFSVVGPRSCSVIAHQEASVPFGTENPGSPTNLLDIIRKYLNLFSARPLTYTHGLKP